MPVPRAENTAAKPGVNPWVVAVVVSLATFMEVLDTSIANVALGHIVGSLGAGASEATWILTSYLAANAIVIPISGWLSSVTGRKRFYMICVGIFTVSSFLCGIAPSLPLLLLFRVTQGAGGGGLQPSSQSMLADTFPGKYFGMAFAVYGLSVVVAPALGPALGGWITDSYSWRWIFIINVPVGLLSMGLTYWLIQDAPPLAEAAKRERANGLRVDYVGFAFTALAFGCLQVVLDKGQEDDWFGSSFITVLTALSVTGILGLIVWETTLTRHPIVDLPLMASGNLSTSLGLQFVAGILLNATAVLVPLFAQQLLSYDATKAGLLLMPGGLIMAVAFPLTGQLIRKVQPKYLMATGLLLMAGSQYRMSMFDTQVSFASLAWSRFWFCLGLPLFYLPINTIAYANLPPGKSNNASALMNLMRNLGGGVGIAVIGTLLDRRSQVHQSYLAAKVSHSYMPFVHQIRAMGGFTQRNIVAFYGIVHGQALMLSYIDDDRLLMVMCVLAIGVVLLLRRVNLKEPVAAH